MALFLKKRSGMPNTPLGLVGLNPATWARFIEFRAQALVYGMGSGPTYPDLMG